MTLYDTDVYAWAQEQAALLREGAVAELDLMHLAEEIDAMRASAYRTLSSAIYQILVHLLKWRYRPERRGRNWQVSLVEQRNRVPRALSKMPSLAREMPTMVTEEYPRACRKASVQTDIPVAGFPATCPWDVEQILDHDFYPEATP